MALSRKHKNRRFLRQNVLDVRLRTREVRAARIRLVFAACSLAVGAALVLFLLWRAGEWTLDKLVFRNPAFIVRALEIESGKHLPAELVRSWSGFEGTENLIDLDLERVKARLEALPVLRSVALQRVPPQTLRIRVVPRIPVAEIHLPRVRPQGGLEMEVFYVDDEGCVIQFPEATASLLRQRLVPEPLPRLTGVSNVVAGRVLGGRNVQAALRLIGAFQQSAMLGLTELDTVNLEDSTILQVKTSHGNQVTFGLSQFALQLERWRRIHDYAAARGQVVVTLDLSVSNNVPVVLDDKRRFQQSAGSSANHPTDS